MRDWVITGSVLWAEDQVNLLTDGLNRQERLNLYLHPNGLPYFDTFEKTINVDETDRRYGRKFTRRRRR